MSSIQGEREALRALQDLKPGVYRTCDTGSCAKCGGYTSSGSYRYCPECAWEIVRAALSAPQEEAGADDWPMMRRDPMAPHGAQPDFGEIVLRLHQMFYDASETSMEFSDFLDECAAKVIESRRATPPVAQPGENVPVAFLTVRQRGGEWTARVRPAESSAADDIVDALPEGQHPLYLRAPAPVAGSRETEAWPRLRAVFERIWPTLESYLEGHIGDLELTATLERLLRAPAPGTPYLTGSIHTADEPGTWRLHTRDERLWGLHHPESGDGAHISVTVYRGATLPRGRGPRRWTMADERPQEHWLNAIAEYTVHAPNCPFYEDGNCECAVEEFRATLRRVLVPSNLRGPSEGTREEDHA